MGIKKTHLEVKELLEKTATDPSKGITFRDLVRFTLLSKGIQIKDKGTSDPGDIPEKMVIPDIVSTFVKVIFLLKTYKYFRQLKISIQRRLLPSMKKRRD